MNQAAQGFLPSAYLKYVEGGNRGEHSSAGKEPFRNGNFSRWVTATLSPSHWFCQRAGFYAGNVFVWLFFWSKYDRHRIFYRQAFRCLFCEIVWLQLDLFLSLALYFSFFVKIDGVSNHEFRLTPPENLFN